MERFISDILNHLIGHFVITHIHQPLCQCRNQCTHTNLNHHLDYSREIHFTFSDHIVNCMSCQLWNIKCKRNRYSCKQNWKYVKNSVSSKSADYLFQCCCLTFLFFLTICLSFISHWLPPPLEIVNNRFPDRPDNPSAILHVFRFLPLLHHPTQWSGLHTE